MQNYIMIHSEAILQPYLYYIPQSSKVYGPFVGTHNSTNIYDC